MTRLRDFYEHKLLEASGENRSAEFETYEDWLSRNNLSEKADDDGVYGDVNPSWSDAGLTVNPV